MPIKFNHAPKIIFQGANRDETQPAGPCWSLRWRSSEGNTAQPTFNTWGSWTGAPLTGLEPLESGIPPTSSSPLTMFDCYSSRAPPCPHFRGQCNVVVAQMNSHDTLGHHCTDHPRGYDFVGKSSANENGLVKIIEDMRSCASLSSTLVRKDHIAKKF